jgi:exonuclease SbcC
LLSEGKCPTCGQELEESGIACATEESEKKKEKMSVELIEIKVQQAEIEKKLNRLKDAKKLKKRISDYDLETEKLIVKGQDLEERMKIHKSRIIEDSLKLDSLNTRKQEFEAEIDKFFHGIKILKCHEEAAQKAHNESENVLRDAKAFEKKLESLGIYFEDLRKKEKWAKKNYQESEKFLMRVKKIQTNLFRIDKIKYKISELEVSISNLIEKIGFFDRDILERNEKIKHLDEKLERNSLEDLQLKRAQFEEAQANITEEIGLKTTTKDSILKEIGMVENNLKRLNELKNELKDLENRLLYLEAIYSNSEELENIYMFVRADMRAKNIDTLSVLLNEMFSFMYANNAYSHIELDTEYNLTVYRKDGTPLEPKLLSGGERAIFNLVLRCAIYRLLSLGFGGDQADGLPPMILDEPTVFLDRGHIRQLLQLIDMMRNIGVGQIIVVSHDESLIDSADHIFQVEKDPLTNMSSIIRL